MDEETIRIREDALRAWFTRDADPILAQIDGLDIGWGGVQRWATKHMPSISNRWHLDFACGYGTFLAQLGWRFPEARLIGLNIDFSGPHTLIGRLLREAGVRAKLVQADARQMPFDGNTFDSASCFLGLQDIRIGFGQAGMYTAMRETIRILQVGGTITLVDEFPPEQFDALVKNLSADIVWEDICNMDVRWDREIAEKAIELYADGWVAQLRLEDLREKQAAFDDVHARMALEMERQFNQQGYYTPFNTLTMAVLRKV